MTTRRSRKRIDIDRCRSRLLICYPGVIVCRMRQSNIERRSLKAVPIVAIITLCVVGAVVSCTVNHDNSTNGPIGPVQGNPADQVGTNQGTVLAALAELGIELAPRGTSRAELLYPVPGEAYRMNPATVKSKEWLFIHQYPSVKAASDHAARIRYGHQGDHRLPDAIDWVNWPHFFRCDHLIVLYLGEQERVLKELSGLCGPQFAGN